MIDADLIKQCADPRLSVEIVQRFVEQVGADDHLTVTVKNGDRRILIPKPRTSEQAIEAVQKYVGNSIVRVGLTQYPAGLGLTDKSQFGVELFDPCENLRMGSALFGKVYRIVTKWYGGPRSEAFDDAVLAWGTGTFEGQSVFFAEEPGDMKVAHPSTGEAQEAVAEQSAAAQIDDSGQALPQLPFKNEDPNKASMRIDLSGIKAHNSEPTAGSE
jgi:hypothetical protein